MPEESENGGTSEDRFKKIKAELEAMKLPELNHEEIDKKLHGDLTSAKLPDVPDIDALTSKTWEAKHRYDAKKRETQKRLNADRESAQGLGMGLQIAYMIIGVPLVFIAIGWGIDVLLKTVIFRGLGALAGSVLGIVLAIVQINRTSNPK